MTVDPLRWDAPWTLLDEDIDENAVLLTVRSDLSEYDVPFDIVIGIEMLTVTARMDSTHYVVTRGVRGSDALSVAERTHFAGARVAGLPETIVVTKGAKEWDYTAIADNLKTKEISPGGELEATWSVHTRNPDLWLPDIDARVVISDRTGVIWSGLVGRVSIVNRKDHHGNDWSDISITARGYLITAGWDGYEDSKVFPAFTAGHTIMETARDERAPLISTLNTYVTHGGQSISQPFEAIGQTPRQIWDRVCAAGDVGEPLDYWIRTDDDGTAYLHVLRRDGCPVIHVPWATVASVPLVWEAESNRSKIAGRYAKGFLVQDMGGSPTRWLYKDYSGQIDNLALLKQIEDQVLTWAFPLRAQAGSPLVLEWPKEVYEDDEVTPIPLWRIRAGWLVTLQDVTAWNEDLPIDQLQIVAVERDHVKHKVSLQLGQRFDDLDIAAQFTGREVGKLGAPASGLIPQYVVPPEGVPMDYRHEVVSWGASGTKIGYKPIGEDADISTIWYGIDGGGSAIEAGRKLSIPIDNNLYVRGLRLRSGDGDETTLDPVTISLTVRHGTAGATPTETDLAALALSAEVYAEKDLSEDQTAPEHVTAVDADEYLAVIVDAGADATKASLGLLIQRREGSNRGAVDAPTIDSVNAARDVNNVTTFTIVTTRLCQAQVEYGPNTFYRSRSFKTEHFALTTTIQVLGLPSDTHYRVHVWNIDGDTTVSADATV